VKHPDAPLIATTDPRLKEFVRTALDHVNDLVVLHRFDRAAGRREWYLMSRIDQFETILSYGVGRDAFTFFLRPHLPIRGILGEALADQFKSALADVPENRSELIICRMVAEQPRLESCEGFSRHEAADVSNWIHEHAGDSVIGGQHPPLLSNDPDELITAVVPDENGRVQLGVY
jgi:hypothetical protein